LSLIASPDSVVDTDWLLPVDGAAMATGTRQAGADARQQSFFRPLGIPLDRKPLRLCSECISLRAGPSSERHVHGWQNGQQHPPAQR